jgi:hypothetical protein
LLGPPIGKLRRLFAEPGDERGPLRIRQMQIALGLLQGAGQLPDAIGLALVRCGCLALCLIVHDLDARLRLRQLVAHPVESGLQIGIRALGALGGCPLGNGEMLEFQISDAAISTDPEQDRDRGGCQDLLRSGRHDRAGVPAQNEPATRGRIEQSARRVNHPFCDRAK